MAVCCMELLKVLLGGAPWWAVPLRESPELLDPKMSVMSSALSSTPHMFVYETNIEMYHTDTGDECEFCVSEPTLA